MKNVRKLKDNISLKDKNTSNLYRKQISFNKILKTTANYILQS